MDNIEISKMINEICNHDPDDGKEMNEWETNFIESAAKSRGELSSKQKAIVEKIWNKLF